MRVAVAGLIGTTKASAGGGGGAPGVPTITAFSDNGSYQSIGLISWTSASGTVTDYQIRYGTNNSTWPFGPTSLAVSTGQTNKSFIFPTAGADTSFYIQLRAMNGATAGAWTSATWVATIQDPSSAP
jgi:hypothetical protein